MQGVADVRRRFVRYGKGIVRIVAAQRFQFFRHVVDRRDDVGVAVFVNDHDDGVFAVDAGVAADALVLALDVRHGRNGNLHALGIRDLYLFDFIFVGELSLDPYVRRRGVGVNRAGGHEDVFFAQGRDDFAQDHVVVDELGLVDFDGDFLVAAAVQLDFRYAVGLLEDILKVVFRFRVDVVQGLIGLDGDKHDRRGVDVALDDDGLVDFIGKLAADGVYLFRGIDGRRVGVGGEVKLQGDAGLAVGGRRRDVLQVGDRRQGVFDGLYDLLFDRVGVGPVVVDRDRDVRRVEGRQQLDADAVEAEQAEDDEEGDGHADADGPVDGKFRKIHDVT